MKIAVAPTVFIALGGTGQIILQRLRERLFQRVGTADLPFFRYLYVDTHAEALRVPLLGLKGQAAAWSVTNQIAPSEDTLRKVQDEHLDNGAIAQQLRIREWFDPHARQSLGTVAFNQGVGGRRMYSRLGFLASQNLGSLVRTLTHFREELITTPNRVGIPLQGIEPRYLSVLPAYVEPSVRFVVVTSAGGGTGSGCFIDMGFLLRKLRREGGWANVYQFGHVALARDEAVGDTLNQVRNSAALLTELDHYQGGEKTYQADYLNLSPGHFEDLNPPYDITYVVAATQQDVPLDGDQNRAFDQLLWKMAEFLLADAVATYPDHAEGAVLPRSGPVGAQAFMGDLGLNPKGLSTYGIACREWPAALVHRQLYGTVIRQIAHSWGQPQPQVGEGVEGELRSLLGIPGPDIQANQTVRDKENDRLLKALLEPVRDLDPCRQLNMFRQEATDARGRLVPGKLPQLQERLRQQFATRVGEPVAGEPGVVYAIVQTNRNRLLDLRQESSLPRRVADRLLDLCVQADAGPATAAEVASHLREAVQVEQRFIAECLEGLNPGSVTAPQRLEQCWQYANDRLLQEVLRAKQEVYQELDRWLDKLSVRLNSFVEYVREWARSIPPADDVQFTIQAPSVVRPPSAFERLRQAAVRGISVGLAGLERDLVDDQGRVRLGLLGELRKWIAQGLPDRDEKGAPTLFAEGPPKHHGATDFSYLQAIERAVFEQIANGAASPYEVEILALLRDESQEKGLAFPNLIGESQFLLNFNRGDSEYARLPFGGNPTHVTEIVQRDQNGFPEFQDAQKGYGGWLKDWESVGAVKRVSVFDEVTDDLNRSTVAYVCERCSIVSKFIVGYSLERRRDLFRRDPTFPAVADIRIRVPPSGEDLQRARYLWLGSLALQNPSLGWVFLGGDPPLHEFTYIDQDQHGFGRSQKWSTSADFERATWALAYEGDVMDAMELSIWNYLRDNLGAATTKIKETTDRVNEQEQRNPHQLGGDLTWLNIFNVNYDDVLSALTRFAVHFRIPLPQMEHRYARFVKAGEMVPGSHPSLAAFDGWYCTRCSHHFGLNMPRRKDKCSVCNNPFLSEAAGEN
jgi:hypothetical protein